MSVRTGFQPAPVHLVALPKRAAPPKARSARPSSYWGCRRLRVFPVFVAGLGKASSRMQKDPVAQVCSMCALRRSPWFACGR